jgi:hypothetical protein
MRKTLAAGCGTTLPRSFPSGCQRERPAKVTFSNALRTCVTLPVLVGSSANRKLCFWSQNHFTLTPRSLEFMNAGPPTQRE